MSSNPMKCIKPLYTQRKKGEIHPGKYIWANPNEAAAESGDCSLKILDANLEFDDGVWQCQVTPSSFQLRDSLISEGAEVVVRGNYQTNYDYRIMK